MPLKIGRLKRSGDEWVIEFPWGDFDLEFAENSGKLFFARDGWWEDVSVCKTEYFSGEVDGEWYEGAAVLRRWTGVLPTPSVDVGEWVAISMWDHDLWWKLEPGMLVRWIGGPIDGPFPIAPVGKCVCDVFYSRAKSGPKLGKVAFDLSSPPFPKEIWFWDGQNFRDTDLSLYCEGSEYLRLMEKFFGNIDEAVWFWLVLP